MCIRDRPVREANCDVSGNCVTLVSLDTVCTPELTTSSVARTSLFNTVCILACCALPVHQSCLFNTSCIMTSCAQCLSCTPERSRGSGRTQRRRSSCRAEHATRLWPRRWCAAPLGVLQEAPHHRRLLGLASAHAKALKDRLRTNSEPLRRPSASRY